MTVGELKDKLIIYSDNTEIFIVNEKGIVEINHISSGNASKGNRKDVKPALFIIQKYNNGH